MGQLMVVLLLTFRHTSSHRCRRRSSTDAAPAGLGYEAAWRYEGFPILGVPFRGSHNKDYNASGSILRSRDFWETTIFMLAEATSSTASKLFASSFRMMRSADFCSNFIWVVVKIMVFWGYPKY